MIYAIGDIHGELGKLHALLNKISARGLSPSDRFVFLGDYVDRGPDTSAVLDLLVEFQKQRPNSIFLRGNHDQVMLDARDVFDKTRETRLTINDINWWFSYGGRETIESYPRGDSWYKQIPDSHWCFLENTLLEFREGNYAFVHAGFLPEGKRWRRDEDPRMWVREEFIGSKQDFGKIVIFGHTPQDMFWPCVMDNKVGIDTGAAYGGPLTALALEPEKPYDRDRLTFIQTS